MSLNSLLNANYKYHSEGLHFLDQENRARQSDGLMYLTFQMKYKGCPNMIILSKAAVLLDLSDY